MPLAVIPIVPGWTVLWSVASRLAADADPELPAREGEQQRRLRAGERCAADGLPRDVDGAARGDEPGGDLDAERRLNVERGRVRRGQRHAEGEAEDAEIDGGDTRRGRLHQRQITDEQVDAGDPDERGVGDGELEVGEAIQAVLDRGEAERDTRGADPDRARDDRLVISREAATDTDEQRSTSDLDKQSRLRATQAATGDRLLRDMRGAGRGNKARDRQAGGEGDIERGRVRRRQRHPEAQAKDAEVDRSDTRRGRLHQRQVGRRTGRCRGSRPATPTQPRARGR